MAENLKYNLRDELLEADETLKGSNSLIGMTLLTNSQYNNSARSVMNTSHLKQFVSLLNPETPGVFTGGENLVGKYSSGYNSVKHKTKVIEKVVKYDDILDEPTTYSLFVYDKKTKTYDVIERKEYENLTEVYGYKYDNREIDSLEVGDDLDEDTVLYKSTSYDENMNYGYGRNILAMYSSDLYTVEDACVPSMSMAQSMVSTEIVTTTIGINENDFLLNLYGTRKHYQGFPEIGEIADGLIAAKRTLFNNQLLVDFKDSELSKMHDSDIPLFGNGQVIDITVYCNNQDIEETPFNAQILKYYRSQTKYYEKIANVCEDIMQKCSDKNRKITHNLDYLYKRALEFLDPDKKWKDNDSTFSNIQLKIVTARESGLTPGQKIVGRSGNKSVVSIVRPDNEMPYAYIPTPVFDENGNYEIVNKRRQVDLLYNNLGLSNRTTGFPIIEMHINFITDRVVQHMWELKTTEERAEIMFDVMTILNKNYGTQMKAKYDSLSPREKDEYIWETMNDRIYICQPPMWEEGEAVFYKFLKIHEKYEHILQPYDIYVEKWGREIKTLRPAYLGSMYYMKLKQTSRKGFSVRGTGSINNKGLPERSYKNKSHTEKYSSTPIRFGEFETLNFTIGMLPEDIQNFHLMYRTSIKGRREIAKNLLLGNEEFKISDKYTSRTAEIFHVILKSMGVRLEFVDEDDEVREYDDSTIQQFEFEGKDYLCTEYQFMLMKRRKEVEKEVLSQFGVIDGDEFEQRVMEILKSRNYIIGPDKSEYDSTPGFKPDTVED